MMLGGHTYRVFSLSLFCSLLSVCLSVVVFVVWISRYTFDQLVANIQTMAGWLVGVKGPLTAADIDALDDDSVCGQDKGVTYAHISQFVGDLISGYQETLLRYRIMTSYTTS